MVDERLVEETDEDVEVIELDEEASDLEKAQASVGEATGQVVDGDPLKALLDWDTSVPISDYWFCKRLGVKIYYEAFQDDTAYDSVVEHASRYVKRRGGQRVREVDGRKLSRLVVIDRVTSPPFSPARGRDGFSALAEKYGSEEPEVLLTRALLPGEIDTLAEKILELSGYEDDLEVAAGN